MDLSDHLTEPFTLGFEALTDYRPLRWQRRLFVRLCAGNVPAMCDLPTGLGKTSVIPIWLIALATQAQNGKITLPRRLVYIVNRRTVVDQATNVVQQIRERLLQPANDKWMQHESTLAAIARALDELSGSSEILLAVSTLRGELADNEEWKADPARPAIIIGTIDMIGSKLLFSGYGDGPYWRPQHAGLIGQDSLIVHDEAHLTPAFSELLAQVAQVQQACSEPRPIRFMELSATARKNTKSSDDFGLEPEDYQDETVRLRLSAKKDFCLNLIEESELIENLVTRALSHESENAKVLIYVRRPEDAQAVAKGLRKRAGQDRVALLTGTIRGYERDRLAEKDPAYRAFLNSDQASRSVYLVSTSAGEVGVDLDADHMVCDATTLEAMIQRLGRVNRRGGVERHAKIDLLGPKQVGSKDLLDRAIAATISMLNLWQKEARDGIIDVSPESLRKLLEGLGPNEREQAFAPKPTILPLTDILLDAWSMTSIKDKLPGRPEVAEYLRGLTNDPPETYVAWRKEITLLKDPEADPESLEDWFRACPILSHEQLRDMTSRVRYGLNKILQQRRKNNSQRDFPVVLLDQRGEAEWRSLSEVAEKNSKIEYRTIVLPTQAGGLNRYRHHRPGSASAVLQRIVRGGRWRAGQRSVRDGEAFRHHGMRARGLVRDAGARRDGNCAGDLAGTHVSRHPDAADTGRDE